MSEVPYDNVPPDTHLPSQPHFHHTTQPFTSDFSGINAQIHQTSRKSIAALKSEEDSSSFRTGRMFEDFRSM